MSYLGKNPIIEAAEIAIGGAPLGTGNKLNVAGYANVSGLMNITGTLTCGDDLTVANDITTGTVTSNSVIDNGVSGWKSAEIVAFDFTDSVTTGDGAAYFHVPSHLDGFLLKKVHGQCIVAGTTGNLTVQIYNATTAHDLLSTKIQVDSGQTGSQQSGTQPVINTSYNSVAENNLLRIDVDTVSTSPQTGLIITMEFGRV